MSDEQFLARWSRRKQEAKAGDAEPTPEGAAEANGPASSGRAAEEPVPAETELSNLPPIESIEAATDVTAFLRKGIPQELSRAALRRAWSADPAIRDFVGWRKTRGTSMTRTPWLASVRWTIRPSRSTHSSAASSGRGGDRREPHQPARRGCPRYCPRHCPRHCAIGSRGGRFRTIIKSGEGVLGSSTVRRVGSRGMAFKFCCIATGSCG